MLTEEEFEKLDTEIENYFREEIPTFQFMNPSSTPLYWAYMRMGYLQEFKEEMWRDLLESGKAKEYLLQFQEEYKKRWKQMLDDRLKRHPEIEAETDPLRKRQMKEQLRSQVLEIITNEVAPIED